ncbi:MAG: hypothetical protein OXC53_02175 [Rhodobacteraceae bacterium]|nr:hypothetical protein [Paracoccaceae bacterium]
MNREVRFYWRQGPPKSLDPLHLRLAQRLKNHLKRSLPHRPWSKQLRVSISADKPSAKRDGKRLIMWVILPSPIDAFWAASLMGLAHRCVLAVDSRVQRIAVTAPKEQRTGYAPLISWRSLRSDPRVRSIRQSELQTLVRHLAWCASITNRTDEQAGVTVDLLMHLSSSPGLQWEAICSLIHHASRQGFLTCSANEALNALTGKERARQPDWTDKHGMTRWQAIKTLVDYGLLADFVGRQRALRPTGSSAQLGEIQEFIANACCLTVDDLSGGDRHAHIMHARHLAAAVMRRATSRTLIEIGQTLGQRDHATIINGLERIEKWRCLDPIHAWLVETLSQIADNMGLLKVSALRQEATAQLSQGYHQLPSLPAEKTAHHTRPGPGYGEHPAPQNKADTALRRGLARQST